jgi:hypothetical protein
MPCFFYFSASYNFVRYEPAQFFSELEIQSGGTWKYKKNKIRLLAKKEAWGHPWFDRIAVQVGGHLYAAECLGFVELVPRSDFHLAAPAPATRVVLVSKKVAEIANATSQSMAGTCMAAFFVDRAHGYKKSSEIFQVGLCPVHAA